MRECWHFIPSPDDRRRECRVVSRILKGGSGETGWVQDSPIRTISLPDEPMAADAILFPRGQDEVIDALLLQIGHLRAALLGVDLSGRGCLLVIVIRWRPLRKSSAVGA
jgi:hypothetical protein